MIKNINAAKDAVGVGDTILRKVLYDWVLIN
jgi:hypothetical protein